MIFHLKKGGIVTKCIDMCSIAFSFPSMARLFSAYIVLTCIRGVNNNELDVARALRLVI